MESPKLHTVVACREQDPYPLPDCTLPQEQPESSSALAIAHNDGDNPHEEDDDDDATGSDMSDETNSSSGTETNEGYLDDGISEAEIEDLLAEQQ